MKSLFTLGFFALFGLGSSSAQNSAVSWSSFGSASAISQSGNTALASSVGESFIGLSQNGNSWIGAGFLPGLTTQSGVTAVENEGTLPLSFELYQNFPNPFNPSTTIMFDVPWQSRLTIAVYNLLGQQVVTLVNEEKSAGRYSLMWHGRNNDGAPVATGVYFYRIQAESLGGQKQTFVQTRKLVLVK